MKPHNQHAPGLGRISDKIGSLAKKHRAHVDKELAEEAKRKIPEGVNGEREAAA